MSRENSFDLDNAIQQWREGLSKSPALRTENLNELESHLRDSIVTLQASGLSPEESLIIAARRVGANQVVEVEFQKINSSAILLDRTLWMLLGIVVWTVVSILFTSIADCVMALGWRQVNPFSQDQGNVLPVVLFSSGQIFSVVMSLWASWWVITNERFHTWFGQVLRRRSGFLASCITLSVLAVVLYGCSIMFRILLIQDNPVRLSTGVVWPVCLIGLVVTTLFIARKRVQVFSRR